MADSNGNGYWYALADNNALQSSGCSPNCTTYWSQSNKSVAVPLNQWFLAEWNIVRSTSGGTYQMAINGTTVISHSGQTDQNPSEQLVMLAFQNLYTGYLPAYQWLDDFELWDSPPCTTFPCGSGGSNAPQPPTNVTATVR